MANVTKQTYDTASEVGTRTTARISGVIRGGYVMSSVFYYKSGFIYCKTPIFRDNIGYINFTRLKG